MTSSPPVVRISMCAGRRDRASSMTCAGYNESAAYCGVGEMRIWARASVESGAKLGAQKLKYGTSASTLDSGCGSGQRPGADRSSVISTRLRFANHENVNCVNGSKYGMI